MPDIELTFAAASPLRLQPLIEGGIQPEGIHLTSSHMTAGRLFWLVPHSDPFDVTEMSVTGYLWGIQHGKDWVALPVIANWVIGCHAETLSRADRGILNRMILRGLQGEAITVYGKGEQLRDYVFVEDVVQAFLAAGAAAEALQGGHYVIGSGQGHTIAEAFRLVADRVAARTGRNVPVNHVEPPAGAASIDSRNFVSDPSRFMKLTGWKPGHALAAGIDRTIEFCLHQGQS